MQILLFLIFKVFFVLYLVIWAILLLLCWRKKRFYPVIGDSKTTKYFWLATFVFFNPVLTVLYFIFGQIRSPEAEHNRFALPAALAFVIAGFYLNFPGVTHLWMQPLQGRGENESGFNASLALTQSSDSTMATSYTSNSDNSRLACKNIVILAESDHVLLKRVSNLLQDMIKEIPNVETVNYHDSDSIPLNFDFTPDMFISLNLNNFKENIMPYVLKLEAEFQALIGDTVVKSGHSSISNRTPPNLGYSLRIKVTHNSETNGYESERYQQAAKDIAEQIFKHIEDNLKKWKEKYGLLPEIPEYLYGKDKQQYEMPEPLKSFGARQLYSYSGLLKNNETILQLDIKGNFTELLNQLKQEMVNIGWTDLDTNLYQEDMVTINEKQNFQIQMKKGNRQLYILKRWGDDSAVTLSDKEQEVQTRLYIRDVEMFSDEQLYTALDKLFEESLDIETLILFNRMFNDSQQDRFFELLSSRPLSSLNAQIRLAEMHEERQMPEKAKEALRRAAAMFWITPEPKDYKKRMKNLAEKLGDEKLIEENIDSSVLLELGCIEIAENECPDKIEADPDENVILFSRDEDGKIQILFLKCTPKEKPGGCFEFSYIERKGGDKSWGTREASRSGSVWHASHYSYNFPEGCGLACEIRSEKNSNKYVMSFDVHSYTKP